MAIDDKPRRVLLRAVMPCAEVEDMIQGQGSNGSEHWREEGCLESVLSFEKIVQAGLRAVDDI